MALIAGNLLTLNEQDIETDASGWGSASNCTLAQSTVQAFSGTHSLSLTSVAAGDMFTNTGALHPIQGNTVYPVTGQLWAATAARQSFVFANWYDSGHTFIGNDFTVSRTTTVGAWAEVKGSLQPSPTNARFAQLGVYVSATGAAGEVHYADFLALIDPPGAHPIVQIPPGFRAPMAFQHSLRKFPLVYVTWQMAAACSPRVGLIADTLRAPHPDAAWGNRAGMAIQSPSVAVTWLPAGDVGAAAGLVSVPPLMVRRAFAAAGGLAATAPTPNARRTSAAVVAGAVGRVVPAAVAVRRPTVSVGGLGRTSPGLGFLRQSSAVLRAMARVVPSAVGVRTVQPVTIGGRAAATSTAARAPQMVAAVRARGAVTMTPAPARLMTASISGLARGVNSFTRGSQPAATILARTGGQAAGVAVRQSAGTGSGRARATGFTLAVRQLGAATGGQGRLPAPIVRFAALGANVGGLARSVLVALRAPQPAASVGGRARIPAAASRLSFMASTLTGRAGTSTTPIGVRPTASVVTSRGGLGTSTLRSVPTVASLAARARFAASLARSLAAGAARPGNRAQVEAHPTAGPPPPGPTFEPTAVHLTLTETGVRPLPPRHR